MQSQCLCAYDRANSSLHMLILGIETSCDETAAAIVEDGVHVRSNIIATQFDVHARYGGVVPELALMRIHVAEVLTVNANSEPGWELLMSTLRTTGVDELDAAWAMMVPGLARIKRPKCLMPCSCQSARISWPT